MEKNPKKPSLATNKDVLIDEKKEHNFEIKLLEPVGDILDGNSDSNERKENNETKIEQLSVQEMLKIFANKNLKDFGVIEDEKEFFSRGLQFNFS